jgi:AbrB family looped-hinge helix DNA binding protein
VEITRLSTKGQIVLPQSIRVSKAWESGTEFSVEETADGVLLRPLRRFPETRLEDIAGCLRFSGRAKTVAEMDAAVGREVRRRHDRRRH